MYKIALLFLYYRIFPLRVIKKWGLVCGGSKSQSPFPTAKSTCTAPTPLTHGPTVSTAWNIACLFAATFQCTPVQRLWNPWLDGYCIDLFLTQLCVSVPSIMCDIAILAFPLPHIVRLKTNLTQKICLIAIFLLGSYVVFTSIYRFKVFLQYSNDDIPFTLAIPIAWNVIEISSGIVSSCLPTLVCCVLPWPPLAQKGTMPDLSNTNQGPIIRPILKSVMPSSLGASGQLSYGKNRRGGRNGSTPGLITIGSMPRHQDRKGAWPIDDFDHSPRGHHHVHLDDYNSTAAFSLDNIEMGRPHTVITSDGAARRSSSGGSSGHSGGGAQDPKAGSAGSLARGSDEWPLPTMNNSSTNGGISKTVKVEWTVEEKAC